MHICAWHTDSLYIVYAHIYIYICVCAYVLARHTDSLHMLSIVREHNSKRTHSIVRARHTDSLHMLIHTMSHHHTYYVTSSY